MQKEKLAIIGLIVIIIVALSAFIAITYGQDILNNLFGGQGEVSAEDDSIICYENINNNISKILSNDQINLTSLENQIRIVTQPTNGVITITNTSIRYTPNTNFLGADSFVYRITQDDKSSQATVTISVEVAKIEIGDCTDLYYIGMFTNGTVFDTNIEDVAKAHGIYNDTNSYNVSRVFVDPSLELIPPEDFEENYTSDYIQGFLKGLIGMGEGETKNVTILPEDAYGVWNESLAQEFMMDSIPLDNIIESNVSENITDFSSYYPDVNVTVGETFDYGVIAFGQANIMNATITEVTDENITYHLSVENGTKIVLPLFNWNVTFIVENDTAFNMHSEIEVNHTFTYGDYWGAIHFKVIDVNETAAKLAVNMEAPSVDFVGQTLVFELRVVNIYKTSAELES